MLCSPASPASSSSPPSLKMQIQTQLQPQTSTRWMLELESTPGRRTAPYRSAGCAAPPPTGPALRSRIRAAWALLHPTLRDSPPTTGDEPRNLRGGGRRERRRGSFCFSLTISPLPPSLGVSKGTGISTRFSRNAAEGILKELEEKTHSQEVLSHAKLRKELKMLFLHFATPPHPGEKARIRRFYFPSVYFFS